MSKNYQGIFLFSEWLDALNRLPPKTAMCIINNIHRYNSEGIEPAPLAGSADLVQSIMLAHEKRSQNAAGRGRRGAEARWHSSARSTQEPPPVQPTPLPISTAIEDDPTPEDLAWDAQREEIYARVRAKRQAASMPPR